MFIDVYWSERASDGLALARNGPGPWKADTSRDSYATLTSVAEVSVSKTSGEVSQIFRT